MLRVVDGEEEVVLRLSELAARRVTALAVPCERRRANGPDLAGEGCVHLEEIRVGVDVDDLAEARMRCRAVVALEEVLHHDLPVRLDRPLVMGVEAGSRRRPARSRPRSRATRRGTLRAAPRRGRGSRRRTGPRCLPRRARAKGPWSRSPAHAPSGALAAGIRPGCTSTRGTGTGASRGTPSPRRRGVLGDGRR